MDRVAFQPRPTESAAAKVNCFHCGLPCVEQLVEKDGKAFCCDGCRLVHDILLESNLGQFYNLNEHPGIRPPGAAQGEQFAYLDEPPTQAKLLDFTDGISSRVTIQIPSIHCVACVWLLENLFRLHPAIGDSRVNFARREVSIRFATQKLKLSELVALLASIGYTPHLTLDELDRPRTRKPFDRQKLQIGLAGFAFANIMLFSIPVYLGLDALSGPMLQKLFGYLSLALTVPVLLYSAADYWKSARWSLQQRTLTLDIPIALGLAALFAQSTYEIVSGQGEGYLDSLVGLVFFLLCGRWFQQKTHDRLTFDRDYRSFFPLAVLRRSTAGDTPVTLAHIQVGDRLLLRHGELIPADARLVQGKAQIDYSFVTGESKPVPRSPGDHLYAGGRHTGGLIEVEVLKPVSQSYLTSLWDHSAFRKQRDDPINTLTQRYGRRFTRLVITIALGSALYWSLTSSLGRGVSVMVAVLIVACPCALALAAPFSFGTAQRWLARRNIFVKSALVLERLARVHTVVLDKTGTLTGSAAGKPLFEGSPLTPEERAMVSSLAQASTHPLSRQIHTELAEATPPLAPTLSHFKEIPGSGLEATVGSRVLRLGSLSWLRQLGIAIPDPSAHPGSTVGLAIDQTFRGAFHLGNTLRPAVAQLLDALGNRYPLALLSGDQSHDHDAFRTLFGPKADLRFNQSPLQKLEYIQHRQATGQTVLMVGDGLNDAGAFQQSDVGVAVVERIGAFSPASDVILDAAQVPALADLLRFARRTIWVVRLSLGLSALYNVVGLSIAAAGLLSPLICAILMPLSSISVVLFATSATSLAFQRFGLTPAR
ncbi:MAG: heavy metal translocating P-type ATPase metal-binding domain-containing protein [Verrucomicrobia bacterium]|nr:heavy metal translocating P-type ATPase metal-binding domain-containing protein [Verrucomicrobiota bacterium]